MSFIYEDVYPLKGLRSMFFLTNGFCLEKLALKTVPNFERYFPIRMVEECSKLSMR